MIALSALEVAGIKRPLLTDGRGVRLDAIIDGAPKFPMNPHKP